MDSHLQPHSESLLQRITKCWFSAMNDEMRNGTLSSYKMDTRIGNRVIQREIKDAQENSMLFEKRSASIFKSQEGSSQTIRRSSSKRFQDLQWTHDTNTRHRSEMNMIAERAVRRVREGTATAMVQSGLHGGGTVRRNFVATGGTRMTKWPMERQHTRMLCTV